MPFYFCCVFIIMLVKWMVRIYKWIKGHLRQAPGTTRDIDGADIGRLVVISSSRGSGLRTPSHRHGIIIGGVNTVM